MEVKSVDLNSKRVEQYGVKGMKWGVRRSQAQLDRAAKRRSNSPAARKKEAQGMSDSELKTANKRLQMEKQYVELTSSKTEASKVQKGAKIAGNLMGQIGKQVVAQQGAARLNKVVNNLIDGKPKR